MINPGHGGHDSDDRGMPNGFWESEGNLTKGLWLRDLLEARGCEVIMSRVLNRTEDDLPLSQIAEIANQNEVDLFISIHSNAGNQSTNYCMTIFNGKSETPTIPESKIWAKILWQHLVTNKATFWTNTDPNYIGDLTLNPSWTYGYGVLYPLAVPGIISEGSMHDYRPEMDRLLNLEYRKQEAWNMLYAMEEYFQLQGNEPFGNIAGIIRDSLLIKDHYRIEGSPDKYHVVNNAVVELLETGETYFVDTLNTGYYYFDSIPPGDYHLKFSAYEYFNDTVAITVLPHGFTYHNHWLEADKTMPPELIHTTPSEGGTIGCYDPITFTFDMNMDSASFAEAFSIEPPIDGNFTWGENYLKVSFLPVIPYETLTNYTIFIDSTAMHQWEVSLDTTYSLNFVTGDRNRYSLENSFPSDEQANISPYLQFRLIFDAPLNNSSLINAVKIVTSEGETIGTRAAMINTFEGKGHYYFEPSKDLDYDKEYNLLLAGSIKDEDNIPLVDTLEITFTTGSQPGPMVVLDEMENPSGWSIDFLQSPGLDPGSFLYKWSKTYRSGAASLLMRYAFTESGASAMLKPVTPIALNPAAGKTGMWIWGEMSYNDIFLGFDNETHVLLTNIDFAGWKYCTVDIPEGATKLTFIRITNTENGAFGGDLYFDRISQPDITGRIVFPEKNIKVYPNPVSGNVLWVEGLKNAESQYSIFSLDGKLIQRNILPRGENKILLEDKAVNLSIFILKVSQDNVDHNIIINNQN